MQNQYKQMKFELHVRQCADMYIGSIQPEEIMTPIYSKNQENQITLEYKKVKIIPGLLTVIGEILTNARDVIFQQRKQKKGIQIYLDFDEIEGEIVLKTVGKGIPIEKQDNIFIPELIFSHERTSSNYQNTNLNDPKLTGGKNGYGAKLTNVLSEYFEVETKYDNLIFKQLHYEGNTKHSEPQITHVKINNNKQKKDNIQSKDKNNIIIPGQQLQKNIISFVNGLPQNGGTHVNFINQIIKQDQLIKNLNVQDQDELEVMKQLGKQYRFFIEN
ncbi:DNA topoisomerase II (macronuclear) [Tetrahymena thermophila SB210]|uniref:DNA topoisomerase (ATP-hydrolyzing) n=1 Tax=Tetrahymena thermophila (strain SB210) TaxID=312017 RepID=I7MJQ8_TETTS|nr:DNA topoisomerase II [Tetrahymena thermophila SB210]EAR96541.2 DNA topoisomerase II [Tetrahymena thermophila SB210]|eukprot:XP_001016786.2 DNA topoisomerase II [Tetrahymena thermophila SB210]